MVGRGEIIQSNASISGQRGQIIQGNYLSCRISLNLNGPTNRRTTLPF